MEKIYSKLIHTSKGLSRTALAMKSVYRNTLFIILLSLLIPSKGFASHIVGGALTYTYNGANNYTIMLKLYRDCSGVAFPGTAAVSVYQADGSLFGPDRSFTMNGGAIINIPAVLPPCATSPSVVPCVQERTYTISVNLPPSPGGMHLVYSVCCRNPSILNITTPATVGETFYAFIPCYFSQWTEDFTLANGTTTDAGPTAWTRTLGVTPPTSAQVNNGQFEIIGSNNGSMIWSSQVINISAFGAGVNLSANLSKAGANFGNNDTLKLFYSINSGPKVAWPVNGLNTGNWASPRFATANALVGNTIQIYLHARFNANNNSTGKTFNTDMISVYDNTFVQNSSPAYSVLPPLFVCSTNTFSLNHSATDADGDVLVYSMYTPYNDAPAPTFPNNVASIPTVTFVPSYSANSPFNSPAPTVTLNAGTGILNGVANTNGQFVFGVKCQEFRGGILLSEMVRDYQMNTVTCPPFVPAAPIAGSNSPLCVGQTLNLTASFTAGATYSWTGPGVFTSTLINPSITNVTALNAGTYSVTASVAGCTSPPGTVAVVVKPTPGSPTAGSNSPLCVGQTLNLTSTFTAGTTYNWTGPNSFSSALQNPTLPGVSLLAAGVYSVTGTIAGCTGAAGTVNVVINAPPAAPVAASNAPLCAGSTLNLTASLIAGATYSWTGPNAFSSALQNPSIAGITALGAGTYSVTASVGGCVGSAGTTNVVVSPTPAAPLAGSNSPLCEFQTLNLTASTIAGATYNWTGPNAFTAATQNASIPSITILGAGVYSVNATVGGCAGPSGTVNVVINPAPAAPTAGSNSPLCAGQNINLTASPIGGATYSWTGPNSFVSGLQNPTIVGASTLAAGVYSVTATVAGCTGSAGTVSVNVFPIPTPPTLGSNSPVCAGQTLSLTATTIAGATYNWTGPNSFTSLLQNPTVTNMTALEAGTYSVLVTVAGCGSANSTINVVVSPTPPAPTAGSNAPICEGQTLNLTASNVAGATYSWVGPNSFTSTIQNPNIPATTTLAAGVYSVNATVGGCPSVYGTVNVIINPTPAAPVAGSNAPLCIGNTLNLTASTIAGATYNWSGPAAFSSALQNPSIVGATAVNAGTYSVTASIAGCVGPAGTVTVSVSPLPAAPILGSNAPLCEFQTLNLTASTIAGASYNWSGPNSFTSAVQNPNIPAITILGSGVYSVAATIGGCTGPASTINVVVNPAPASPVAGSNSPLCVGSTINLTASTVAGATYNWTGPNSFTSTIQNPSIVGAGTVTSGNYTVTSTVAGCTSAPATVSVSVTAPATVTPGANQTVCGNNAATALNGSSTTGSGIWSTSGSGSFLPNNTILNGTYTPSGADIAAGSVTLTLTSTNNGACTGAVSQMIITITPAPTSNAGANQSVCANNATVALSGAITVASGGIWTSSGTGTFSPNNTSMNAVYICSPADVTAGSVLITLTTTGNGNCLAVSNTMTVTIFPAPVVSAGPNIQFVCKNNPNPTLNASSTTGSGVWQTLGTGAFTPTNNILSPTYLSSTADTTAGSIFIIFTSTNNGTCLAVKDTIQLVYTGTITIGAGASQTVCANNSTIALTATCTTGAGTWTTSGSGTFLPNTLNGIYFPSAADISAGSVTLTVTSGNNGTCLPITSTVVMFFTPAPTANAGPDQTVCANNATVTLSGSFTLATGGIWSTMGTGTFTPNNTNMNSQYISSAADTTAGSVNIILSTTGNGNCLSVKDTMTIFFTPAPLVQAGADIFVCKTNPNAVINATCSTGTGTWTTSGSGTFNPNNTVLNPTYIPSTADTTAGSVLLVLTSINNGGCKPVTDTIKITYSAPPTLTAGASQTVCSNAVVALAGVSSTGSGTWTTSGSGTFAPNTLTGNYLPSVADGTTGIVTLTLTSTNNGGCTAVTGTMTLNLLPGPTANAGSNITICANTPSVALSGTVTIATGGVWSSSGTGTFSPNTTTMNTTYIPSGADTTAGSVMIFLTTTGNGLCNASIDTMKIIFNSAPILNAGPDLFVCRNSPNVLLNGISSAPSHTWTTLGSGTFNPNSSILNPTYNASTADTTAGSVTLILTGNGAGACATARDTVKVFFQSQPKANFLFANKCVNSLTTFTDMSTVSSGTIVSWTWNFGVSTSTVQNPTNTFTTTGTHTVSLVVSTGCKDSITKTVFINSLPVVNFTSLSLCHDSAQFVSTASVTPGSIASYNWNFGDTTFSSIKDPYHVYKDTGNYFVTLSVVSDSGCVASKIDTLHIKKCGNDFIISNPAVPSGFTPNGDGKNDVLYVKGGPFTTLDFRVFNEWGNQIFHSKEQSVGWDGQYKGSIQQAGRYIWTVSGEVIDGRTVKMAGEVILTR